MADYTQHYEMIRDAVGIERPQYLDLLTDESYQQELAHAIAEGILACVGD